MLKAFKCVVDIFPSHVWLLVEFSVQGAFVIEMCECNCSSAGVLELPEVSSKLSTKAQGKAKFTWRNSR